MRGAALLLAVMFAIPTVVSGWGFEGHKFIADRMIDLLPAELKPLFQKRRGFIVEHSIDPDLWRNVGWLDEPPNHFLDIDHQAFGPYPFEGLPRDYSVAVQKFGKAFVHEQGLLPWRVQEFSGMLQREFESLKRKPAPGYALDNIVLYSAILAHYVGDAHVPLHAVVNHNGQLTGQEGLHSRWETELFDRTRARLNVSPAAPKGVTDPRAFIFEALLASNRASRNVLESDQKAVAGREFYDDGYFEAFASGTVPVLERRLNDAITGVASIIIGAWEQAGKPALPPDGPRTPRRIPRPN
jgi:hypothetical protein